MEHGKVAARCDSQHYQEEALYLKQQLENFQHDMSALQSCTTQVRDSLSSRQLCLCRRWLEALLSLMKSVQSLTSHTCEIPRVDESVSSRSSRRVLIKEREKEVEELREKLEELKEKKQKLRSERAILDDKIRMVCLFGSRPLHFFNIQAEQDRYLLLHSLETWRSKLVLVQNERRETRSISEDLVQAMCHVQQVMVTRFRIRL